MAWLFRLPQAIRIPIGAIMLALAASALALVCLMLPLIALYLATRRRLAIRGAVRLLNGVKNG